MKAAKSTDSESQRKINEIKRAGEPARDLAFLMHGVFARRHYPNALAKWRRGDLDQLKRLLVEEIEGVDAARIALTNRDEMAQLYRPVCRSVLERARTNPASLFDSALVEALASKRAGAVLRLLDEPIDFIYRARLLPGDVCKALLEEAARFTTWTDTYAAEHGISDKERSIRGIGKGSAVLDTMGLQPFLDALMEQIVRPLCGILFPGVGGEYLEYRHGYIASYQHPTAASEPSYGEQIPRLETQEPIIPVQRVAHATSTGPSRSRVARVVGARSSESASGGGGEGEGNASGGSGEQKPEDSHHQAASMRDDEDATEAALREKAGNRKGLVAHTDDSEVTVNCCLGLQFKGGEVEFRGLRSTRDEGTVEEALPAVPGIAMFHLGQHLHRVADVTEGQRHALIVWCRSEDYRGANCPCCVLHRRSRCVCDATWNQLNIKLDLRHENTRESPA